MRELIIKNRMLNLMCDKRMKKRFGVNNSVQFTKKEQLIINQGIGYWTVPIK